MTIDGVPGLCPLGGWATTLGGPAGGPARGQGSPRGQGYPGVHSRGVGQGGPGGPAGGQVVIVVGVVQISRVIQVKDNGRQRSDLSPIKSQNNFEVPSFH